MKSVKPLFSKKITLAIAVAIVLFYLSSCAKKVTFLNSSVVPAARGTVKVKKDNNQNYNIKISLSNLAEPGRLQPAKKTYVVWMETYDNAAKNIGQLNSSTGFIFGKLRASFETVSSIKPAKIFLTAEDDGNVQSPGTQVVIMSENF